MLIIMSAAALVWQENHIFVKCVRNIHTSLPIIKEINETPNNHNPCRMEEHERVVQWKFWLEGVLIPAVGLPGFLGDGDADVDGGYNNGGGSRGTT